MTTTSNRIYPAFDLVGNYLVRLSGWGHEHRLYVIAAEDLDSAVEFARSEYGRAYGVDTADVVVTSARHRDE